MRYGIANLLVFLQWPDFRNRSEGDNPRGVDLGAMNKIIEGQKNGAYGSMRPVIVCLDVFKVCRVFECIIVPIKFLHPSIHCIDINIYYSNG